MSYHAFANISVISRVRESKMKWSLATISLGAMLMGGHALADEVDTSTPADISIMSRFHFATHTLDFERAREFYRQIGYTGGLGDFPLTNTHQMARALGMFDVCQYELVDGEVITLPTSSNAANIDLLQFKTPYNDAPPYELPNHLGMAYAALRTTDLAGDVEHLRSLGAPLLSEPYGTPGNQFVFFRDLDGVLYKLVETTPPAPDANASMQLVEMPYIGVNVTDLDESIAFYRMLGYDVEPLEQNAGDVAEGRAYGLDQAFRFRGADVVLKRGDGHRLRLIQWLDPFDPAPPYPAPINHIGIQRIALMVPNLDHTVTTLKERGVSFLSDIAPCCSGTGADTTGIVHAFDPDGIFLEFVGPITPRPPIPQPAHCPPLEIKMPGG